jgi:hypothetical protein
MHTRPGPPKAWRRGRCLREVRHTACQSKYAPWLTPTRRLRKALYGFHGWYDRLHALKAGPGNGTVNTFSVMPVTDRFTTVVDIVYSNKNLRPLRDRCWEVQGPFCSLASNQTSIQNSSVPNSHLGQEERVIKRRLF